MKLENISRRTYQHSILNAKKEVEILELKSKEVKEIPDEVAKIWLLSGEVREYIAPAEAKALKSENDALKKEIETLKAEKETSAETKAKTTTKKK